MKKLLANLMELIWRCNQMHSRYFAKIKSWYEKGLWTLDMVHAAVPKMLTIDEYKQITEQDYDIEEE